MRDGVIASLNWWRSASRSARAKSLCSAGANGEAGATKATSAFSSLAPMHTVTAASRTRGSRRMWASISYGSMRTP